METLTLLGAALGFATLSGINLYLTVFATGLAIQQHWITLSAQYQGLAVLGEPAVVAIAGVLFVVEFLADGTRWSASALRICCIAAIPAKSGGAFPHRIASSPLGPDLLPCKGNHCADRRQRGYSPGF